MDFLQLIVNAKRPIGRIQCAVLMCSYVEVVWADEKYVTEVIDGSLNPEWQNATTHWDILEESALQNDPLIFRVAVMFKS